MKTIRTSTVAFMLIGLTLAGCSSDSTVTTSTAPSTQAPTTVAPTTVAPTTEAPTTVAEVPTTVAAVAVPVMPLSGVPVVDPALAARPALVVKIDNHPQARPQFGMNSADIVYEENVEHLTRFAAVFQSQDAERVGPIRSGRTQDVSLLGSLNGPLFAWSGGNPTVTQAIKDSDFINLSPAAAGAKSGYFRNKRGGEDYEHTLYNSTPTLFGLAPATSTAPAQQFTYRPDGSVAVGDAANGVDLKMDGVKVGWTWDGASASYLRTQDGKKHNDATLGQVNAANVVVLEVVYIPSPADRNSPEAQTIGTGSVLVFTGGVMIRGTWTRGRPVGSVHPDRRRRRADRAHTWPYLGRTRPGRQRHAELTRRWLW